MKIRIEMTVEVDPAEWALQYGTAPDPATVRRDVKAYVADAAADSPAPLAVIGYDR